MKNSNGTIWDRTSDLPTDRMEGVASTIHTRNIVHPALLPLMRTPRLPVVDSTDAPRRLKWTRPFRRKTKSGFCACAIKFQLASTHGMTGLTLGRGLPTNDDSPTECLELPCLERSQC